MKLHAGYGQADITPALPHDLNGFAARVQPAVSVASPVLARVTVLRSGRMRTAIAVCDVLGFRVADSQRLEAAIAGVVGCAAKNVLLACTHTHSGPMSQPLGEGFHFDPSYIDQVEQRLLDATGRALADEAEVTASRVGSVAVSGLGKYRWNVPEPGRDHWPGRLSTWQLHRGSAGPLTFWHLGVHQYLLGPRSRVMHPDYPGPTSDMIESLTGGHAIYLPGCAGDVAPVPESLTEIADVHTYARRAADAAAESLRESEPVAAAPIRCQYVSPRVRFNYEPNLKQLLADDRPITADDDKGYRNNRRWAALRRAGKLHASSPFPMRALRVGGVTLLGMPAEIFCETGLDIVAALEGLHVLPMGHTGGNLGYLCREFAYRHNTYEANAHVWYDTAGAMSPTTEPMVRQAITRTALAVQDR